MNLRTLKYFIAIVDAGSLTAAAQAISVAQPALTRQLRELENEMGVRLLTRTARGVRLTPAGVTLYESAQRMLAEAARVRRQLASRPIAGQASVTLGVSPTLARVLLPGLFQTCRASLPQVRFKAREGFTPALLDWVERGVVDMAVVTNPEAGRGLLFHPLLGEPFALISNHRCGHGPVVPLSQLARVPLLMTTLHREIIERQLLPLGVEIQLAAEIDSVEAIRELVMHDIWATIMPVSVFKGVEERARVVTSEISGVQLSRLLVLVRRFERADHPAFDSVQELIDAEFARLIRQRVFSITPY